jgi:hypothetical protein
VSKSDKKWYNGEDPEFGKSAISADTSRSPAMRLRSTMALGSFTIAFCRSLLCRSGHLSAENDGSITLIVGVEGLRNGCGSSHHSKLSRVKRAASINMSTAAMWRMETGIKLLNRYEMFDVGVCENGACLAQEAPNSS